MPLCFIAAQQLPQYGLYMFEPYSFNPAYGGMNNSISVSADIRKQWSGLAGAPSSQYLTVHMPIYSLNSGVGLMLNNEELGANHQFQGQLSYNYVMSNLAAGLISLGASVGLINRNMDGSEIRTPGGNYENSIQHNDPLLYPGAENYFGSTLGCGIFYRASAVEVGLSYSQIISLPIQNKTFTYNPAAHLILYASYFYKINEDWKIVPAVLLKYNAAVIQSDLDLQIYRNNLIGGLGLRGYSSKSLDCFKINLGGRLSERLLIGYSYEATLSGLKSYSDNTHELFIQYRLPVKMLKKAENVIYHPRM